MEFTNGFDSWQETHFEIVSMMVLAYERNNPIMIDFVEREGTGGMYEKARQLTDDFESKNQVREWEADYFDELEAFWAEELANL